MLQFKFRNIQYKQNKLEDCLTMQGEVTNESSKDYNCVAFRVLLYVKTVSISSFVFTIKGFLKSQTKDFEVRIPELSYAVAKEITAQEIFAESAY
ncbi:MAG: hypothetical protein WC293_02260 [Candidatus Omnitrophota bacterium]|nr:hypothetical protein [Candidatus Omnitrophota bacterium]MDD5664765.1 hypothetical protein [Candidatus Omnitrophota bacterium]